MTRFLNHIFYKMLIPVKCTLRSNLSSTVNQNKNAVMLKLNDLSGLKIISVDTGQKHNLFKNA